MVKARSVIDRSAVPVDSNEFDGVTIVEMPCPMAILIGRRAEAITLGNRIFVHPNDFDDTVSGARPDLVIHELTHVVQWRAEGRAFLARYLGQYFRFRMLGASHTAAYRSISYEMEASAAAASW